MNVLNSYTAILTGKRCVWTGMGYLIYRCLMLFIRTIKLDFINILYLKIKKKFSNLSVIILSGI